MTSEEYARQFGWHLLESARRFGISTNGTAYRRIFSLGVSRIMFDGAEEYEVEPNVQAVEVKPLGDLVTDAEEEVTDLVAYASAISQRDPATKDLMESLTKLAIMQMDILSEVRGEEG